jgi:hypothetical protein
MTDAELDLLEKSMEPIYEQIERNLVYSNNLLLTEERVKHLFSIVTKLRW